MASYAGDVQDDSSPEEHEESIEYHREQAGDKHARKAYVAGFPHDATLLQIRYFFEQLDVGEIYVRMRNYPTGEFKGSVFAVFQTKDEMEKFVSLPTVLYGEVNLKRQTWLDFVQFRKERNKEKSRRKKKQRQERQEIREEKERQEFQERITKDAVLHVTNMTAGTDDKRYLIIKDFFVWYGSVAFVEHQTGQTEAYVRFREAGEARKALEAAKAANDGKIIIQGCEVNVKPLEGEEEIDYWKRMFKQMEKKEKKMRNKEKRERRTLINANRRKYYQ